MKRIIYDKEKYYVYTYDEIEIFFKKHKLNDEQQQNILDYWFLDYTLDTYQDEWYGDWNAFDFKLFRYAKSVNKRTKKDNVFWIFEDTLRNILKTINQKGANND